MHRLRNKVGFTLIELLVVLTIIGVLAALLFPVFIAARERANKAVCVSNLHQIDLAIQMYQEDHNGWLPENFGDASSFPADLQIKIDAQGFGGQLDALLPYEHDPDIYHCPDRRDPVPSADYLRDDYEYRVEALLQCQDWDKRPKAIIKPDSSSVLLFDRRHVQGRNTTYLILRADGGVSSVPDARVALWYYLPNGLWSQKRIPGDLHPLEMQVFPDEPWPPKFEQ